MGEEEGILKLLFDPETLKILGIHIIGPHASELIHLGHSVMFYEGTIQYFMNTVFNSPTLDEAYRIAAFNGMNRLDHESLKIKLRTNLTSCSKSFSIGKQTRRATGV